MKTTLSGCGAGCEIDMALALTDVRFWGVKRPCAANVCLRALADIRECIARARF